VLGRRVEGLVVEITDLETKTTFKPDPSPSLSFITFFFIKKSRERGWGRVCV
jgi:hypothetical protein